MQPCYSRRIEESLWISSQQCLCCSWSFTHIRCSSCSDVLSSMRASKYWSSLERTWTNLHRKSDCHWTLFIYIHIQWTWEKPFVWDPPVLFHRRYANCDLTNIKHYLGAINLRAHTDMSNIRGTRIPCYWNVVPTAGLKEGVSDTVPNSTVLNPMRRLVPGRRCLYLQ